MTPDMWFKLHELIYNPNKVTHEMWSEIFVKFSTFISFIVEVNNVRDNLPFLMKKYFDLLFIGKEDLGSFQNFMGVESTFDIYKRGEFYTCCNLPDFGFENANPNEYVHSSTYFLENEEVFKDFFYLQQEILGEREMNPPGE